MDSGLWMTFVPWCVLGLLTVAGGLGLLAAISPAQFALATYSNSADSHRTAFMAERSQLFRHVLRYSRVFGVLVVAAAVFLAYLYGICCAQ